MKKKKVSAKTSRSSRREPQTMEELLKSLGKKLHGLKRGEEIEGVITDINKKLVLIDIGAKTEGVVINAEYAAAKDFVQFLKIGEKIQAMVVSPENEKGQILLSLKKAASNHKWNLLEEYLKTEEIIEVRGLEVNKGGLITRIFDIRGFIPASQFSQKFLGKIEDLQNKLIKVKVIEVDRKKNRLIFSEKAVSEAEILENQKTALSKVKKDKVYEGIISGVMPFGVFVRVEVKSDKTKKEKLFLEGLVHISEISWGKVDNVKKMFTVGKKIKVKVLEIDENSARLNLSIKRLSDDPWDKIEERYPIDKRVKGEISRLVAFGAFVNLEPGIEGLIHISKVPAEYEMKVGKKVKVYVESIDKEKRRMSLGLVLTEKPVGYK